MNHNSMLKHYRIIKFITQAAILLDKSDSPEIKHRMMWDLGDISSDKSLRLYYTAGSNEFIMTVVNNQTHGGWPVLKTQFAESNAYYVSENYLTGKSLELNGKKKEVRYTEKNADSVTIIQSLPVEAAGALILHDQMEELEFQHSTITAFDEDSFGLYCVFSLLNIVDDITESFVTKNNKNVNHLIKLVTVINDDLIDIVESKVVSFYEKLKKDI